MLDNDGSTPQRATARQLQAWTGKLAAAIHRAAPQALSHHGFGEPEMGLGQSHRHGKKSLWSDSALFAATGDSSAQAGFLSGPLLLLDAGVRLDATAHSTKKASAWKFGQADLDRGSFPATANRGYRTEAQFYRGAVDSGYAGAMAWSYSGVDQYGS